MKPNQDIPTLYREHVSLIQQCAEQALATSGADRLAIFSGAPRVSFRDDWHYPFKPNPHFLAWLPLTEHPHSWLIIEPGEHPHLLYYQPDDYWHQPPADPEGFWTEHFNIEILSEPQQAREVLGELGGTALIGELDELAEIDQPLSEWGFASCNHERLITYLEYHRASKTRYELSCLRHAQQLAVRCHRAAEQAFRAGASEYDIHLAYLQAGQQQDAQLPYSSIVGLNEHGAVLHYQLLDRQAPEQSHSLLIDAGANVNGYAADITRTWVREANEFADLVTEMDHAQRLLCDQAMDGIDYREIHLHAHHAIASLLQRFDLVRMEAGSIVDTGISSTFFPHGIGHLLGLQVHDCGGFLASHKGGTIDKPDGHPFLRLTRRLEPGCVVTIEPGLYFIEPLLARLRQQPFARAVNWTKVQQMMPFGGVRIEDNVAVTVEQPENLTRLAFAE